MSAAGQPGDGWIATVAQAAEFLIERLARRPMPLRRFESADFRRRWAELLGGTEERLAQRFGCRLQAAHRLGGLRLLPTWACQLEALVARAAQAPTPRAGSGPIAANDPIPFEDALTGWTVAARDLLDEHLRAAIGAGAAAQIHVLLWPGAWRALERALLAQLALLSCRVLDREFSRTRPYGEQLLLDLACAPSRRPSRKRYKAFCARMAGDGLKAIAMAYPVLGRLMAVATHQWVDAHADFLLRLRADLPELASTFGASGEVVAIDAALSDRHAGGRTVMALAFASGVKVVYKPKGLGMDAGLQQFLQWFERQGLPLPLRAPAVLDRGSHGWAEFIEHRACADEAAAGRLFERAGMLLCVLHTLRATDCHHENVIARGDEFMLVDVEALLHPRELAVGARADAPAPALLASERFLDSVLRTGMLPRYGVSADRRVAFDVSALGGAAGQAVAHDLERWQAINTDDMHRRKAPAELSAESNLALLDGQALQPHAYVDRIVAGFTSAYRLLASRKAELLASDGPLAGLQRQGARFIYRDSQVYGSLLDRALTPQALKSGAEFGLLFEPLAPTMRGAGRPPEWPLFEAELAALQRLDIPLFSVYACSRQVDADGAPVLVDAFRQPALQDARDQIAAMGEGDLEWQCRLIRGAFAAARATTDAPSPTAALSPRRTDGVHVLALAEALAIGRRLAGEAVRGPQGGVTWVGLGYMLRADKYQFRVLGNNFYDGVPGVAVFLAALHRATGDRRWHALALDAVQDARLFVRHRHHHPHWQDDSQAFIGGAIGLGSIVYALTRVGTLLGEAAVLQDALAAAQALDAARIAQDDELDVMGGSAGALLALLALWRATGHAEALLAATRCGQRLLARQQAMPGTGRAWCGRDGTALTGLSHGAAGIAYALVRLFEATGEAALLQGARDGMAYERGLRMRDAGQWRDLRPGAAGDEGRTPIQWCHGAAGIALARLGCSRALPSLVTETGFEADTHAAIDATLQAGLGAIDHLCCGNFGRVETLLVAAERRDRPDALAAAHALAHAALERAASQGGYGLFAGLPQTTLHPGFFQGLAGIGYQWLRLAMPGLPSVLLWD